MPQEIFSLAPVREATVEGINRLVTELNTRLSAISTELGTLSGRDSQPPTYHSALDMNRQRITNVARSMNDTDAVTRGELAEKGLFSRRTGEAHIAPEVIIALKGVKTAPIVAPGFAVNFDTVAQTLESFSAGTPTFSGTPTFTGTPSFTGTTTISSTGTLVQTGGLRWTAATPAAIAANTNNYAPGTGVAFRISATAPFNVTGLVAGGSGQIVLFINVGANAITLTHEDILSTANNRFHFSTAAPIVMAADAATALFYDLTTLRWRDWSVR